MTPPPPRLILHGAGLTALCEPLANPGVKIEVAWLSLLREHCLPLVCCGCRQWWKGGGRSERGLWGRHLWLQTRAHLVLPFILAGRVPPGRGGGLACLLPLEFPNPRMALTRALSPWLAAGSPDPDAMPGLGSCLEGWLQLDPLLRGVGPVPFLRLPGFP